ncbi:hypothetical protein BH11MYX3_BH11MYX3_15430 [soil metagenome]
MRSGALAVLLLGCSSSPAPLALGEPPSEWEQAPVASHRGAWDIEIDPVLGTARSLSGAGVAFGADIERDAIGFVRANADLFGTSELVVDGTVIDPELSSIALVQQHHGIPVIGGHLGLTVSHGRLVLVQGATYAIGKLATAPAITETDALAAVRAALELPRAGDRDDARLVILPERSPGAVRYRLVWEVTGWRGELQAVIHVDARTGDVIDGYDANRYDYPGRATNLVDQRTVGDAVVEMPASYLRLNGTRGTATTDGDGAFTFRGEAGPMLVTANLMGAYIRVHNAGGPEAQFTGMMRPETAYALEWTESRSTPEERDVFRAVNTTNRYVKTVYPAVPWLEQPLLANVNLPRTCNAYWNGSSINFFVAGNGCNNSGRIFDVVAHEWGHGLDHHLPGDAIDGGLGEFIGDEISFVQTNSPLIGPNFLTDGRPARDLTDPDFRCYDPGKRGVHAKGHLLGAVMWDVYTDLQRAGVRGEPLKRLMLRPIAIAQTRAQWYRAMLAVDDDDGNLANGTPHECLIYNQFKAHSCGDTRWPGIPDRDPPHCR